MQVVGQRIKERLASLTMSQAELARRVQLSQPAINGLVRGRARSTPELHKIARELRTTPAYLIGETDDPSVNAPPPSPPIVHQVLMPVVLPSESALEQMFAGMLDSVTFEVPVDGLARELAQLLPTALSQLKGRLTEQAPPRPAHSAIAAGVATSADHGSQR